MFSTSTKTIESLLGNNIKDSLNLQNTLKCDFAVLQASCFTARSCASRLNPTEKKKSLGWQKLQDIFAALFSDCL